MPQDDASATVRFDSAASGSNSLSQKKLDQPAQARIKSLEVSQRSQKAKLEGKLNAIRSMLGSDMRVDTVERVAKEMVAREEKDFFEVARLRNKPRLHRGTASHDERNA